MGEISRVWSYYSRMAGLFIVLVAAPNSWPPSHNFTQYTPSPGPVVSWAPVSPLGFPGNPRHDPSPCPSFGASGYLQGIEGLNIPDRAWEAKI
ncbi:uncharacterized protein BO87DRAFT_137181 [Aspergillus neoniger CBS 115656]|uniref:Uncharacterized protein n=1 Tax=Aspergillus neoniger (strain CBS 115656) TaxID=1448310 RepID=A0A318YFN7_ASPNB|nr:hypothetical protein BO87DRAFT_137181 [Aspergillus neoniger CBS 115656]PYH31283.1 hypothetical protein BO87DRAFT_137181 [Aspergillus neoniger CBS 115656]